MLDDRAEHNIGRVFTPVRWAGWLLERYDVYNAWRNGATIIDPTCGQGAFFFALMKIAQRKNEKVHRRELSRLFGVEINPSDRTSFFTAFEEEYGITFPEENFICADFLRFGARERFDIAIGNPPWANFTNLPDDYKERVKHDFIEQGLVTNKKEVLLGASRVDFASLIIQKCMKINIKGNGSGYFFVPLSLFFNEDANKNFRPITAKLNIFSVTEIVDFDDASVFEGISTRYGALALKENTVQSPMIPLVKVGYDGSERPIYCRTSSSGGAWSMTASREVSGSEPKIRVVPKQIPRQGMNTGGLNKVFILERTSGGGLELPAVDSFVNGLGEEFSISTKFVFPLMSSDLFGGRKPKKPRFILCLHDRIGRALSGDRLHQLEGVEEYLESHKTEMCGRKGVLMQANIAKGKYWSLLGVGPYSFSKYKVAWESLGKRKFNAIVLDENWQGNQAMHAYIPADSWEDADRLCNELNTKVPAYLEAFGMEGTCNWAQPGRIKRLLISDSNQMELFQ